MKRILFVDDEPNLLEGLERMLFPLRGEWEMSFASSGPRALEIMKEQHFDVVVSDMRMPGMDGAEFLGKVRSAYPDTIRFVLTGQSDAETVYRSVGEAHQFLTKPCKPKTLKESVDRAFGIRELLSSNALKGIVAQIGALPPMPQTYVKLCDELLSSEGSTAGVSRIIESDIAMVSKILQLVNSAFFGLRRQVSTVPQAVALLGFDTLKALVLVTGLFSQMQKMRLPARFSFDALWSHSMSVGAHARTICRLENAPKEMLNDTYTAGLLHDLGELVLASACQEDYTHAYDYAMVNAVSLADAEKELLGCTHAEIGAYLLGIWGLPHPIVEAVAYHHRPSDCVGAGFSPLAAVHVADALVFARHKGEEEYPPPQMDIAFLQRLDLDSRLQEWEKACAELEQPEGD